MLSDEQIEILKDILGEPVIMKRGKEYYFSCPYCNHYRKKLAINVSSGEWHCWKCGKAGKNSFRIVFRFGTEKQKAVWSSLSGEDLNTDLVSELYPEDRSSDLPLRVSLPEEFISLVGNDSGVAAEARAYLYRRGLTEQDIALYKPGFCVRGDYKNRVVFPSFDEDGDLNMFVARSIDSSWPPYMMPEQFKKKIIFNELYLDFSKPIVLTEGIFDSVVARDNAAPALGSYLDEEFMLFRKIVANKTPVYMAFDPDAQALERGVMSLLLSYDIGVMKIRVSPYKDLGVMPREEFARRKEEASVIDSEYFLYEALEKI